MAFIKNGARPTPDLHEFGRKVSCIPVLSPSKQQATFWAFPRRAGAEEAGGYWRVVEGMEVFSVLFRLEFENLTWRDGQS